MQGNATYDLRSVKLPRLTGVLLRLYVFLLEFPLTRPLLIGSLVQQAGIAALRGAQVDDAPTFDPLEAFPPQLPATGADTPPVAVPPAAATPASAGSAFATVDDYARAYGAGRTTPDAVAERVLAAIEESNARQPPLRAVIACKHEDVLAQARASAQRFSAGRPLGPWDGVPVAVKDEVDMLPYPTTVGTRFLGAQPATQDSTVVARMRSAGAMLIGKTNMHEIGIGPTGLNVHHGTPRNPYNPGHYTGGSSSGSAAAVAAGLCPVAIGADGGGSIRIPAALCGVYGLKPTHGRTSEFGAAPLCWSVAHLGPIAASARDLALGYTALAGPDTKDPLTRHQPPVTLDGFQDIDLKGLTLGVYWPWFRHASPEVVAACEALLGKLQAAGAQLREIAIPELEAARIAHVVTIVSEMAAALDRYHATHGRDYSLEVRLNLIVGRSLTSRDYVQAQRMRTRLLAHLKAALQQAQVIVTPATACTAPPIRADVLPDGESDLSTLFEIMRYATPANLSGFPAISFPAGYDGAGLPIGLQAMAGPWQEHVLLRLAHAAEGLVERQPPAWHYRLL